MLFDSVAFKTSFELKYWLFMLMKQFAGVRHLMFEPLKLDSDTALFAQEPIASNDKVPA